MEIKLKTEFSKESTLTGNNQLLRLIEYYFLAFLKNEEDQLTLNIPFYEASFCSTVYNSLREIALKYKLSLEKEISDYEGTCLLNIFNTHNRRGLQDISDFVLLHKETKNKFQIWQNGVVTHAESFLPVFKANQIQDKYTARRIAKSFPLFTEIRNDGNIQNPVLIDLEQSNTLIFNTLKKELTPCVLENIVDINNKLTTDEAIVEEERLHISKNWLRLNACYPYAPQPHSYLMDIGEKRFDIKFYNRFFYKDANDSALKILPQEYLQDSYRFLCDYEIYETKHTSKLYDLLYDLKQIWNGLGFNKYTSPFPKYWFLFINKELSKKEWKEEFRKTYPHVAQIPLINRIEEIITELHDLDWVDKYINQLNIKPIFVFPKIKGLREKRLEKAYLSFKNHINRLSASCVESIEEIATPNGKEIVLLNSFDVINLANVIQCNQPAKVNFRIVVPDFLYFAYQPWIKYYLFNYQAMALTNEIRSVYSADYEINTKLIDEEKQKLIKNIKKDLKSYNESYNSSIEEEIEGPSEESSQEDYILTNDEELEQQIRIENETSHSELKIITTDNEIVTINSNEKIYQLKHSLSGGRAENLNIGDLFFSQADLKELATDNNWINKLNDLPAEIRYYQAKLHEIPGSDKLLKMKGISYMHESSLQNKIIPREEIDNNNFVMPRRYSDWEIICNLLSIDSHTMDLAFIAYYGRGKRNKITDLYKSIISSMIENDWFGSTENPQLIECVEKKISINKDLFSNIGDLNYKKLARVFISNIMYELPFREVKSIKTTKL